MEIEPAGAAFIAAIAFMVGVAVGLLIAEFPQRRAEAGYPDDMTALKQWYLHLPNSIRAGINSAWQSALGSFALTMLGFLSDIQEWSGDTTRPFPAVTPLGKAVGSILVGLVVGVLTAGFRAIKPGPQYPSDGAPRGGDRGDSFVQVLIGCACIIVIIAGIVWLSQHI